MGGGGGRRCCGARAGGRYWLRIINRCIVHIVASLPKDILTYLHFTPRKLPAIRYCSM